MQLLAKNMAANKKTPYVILYWFSFKILLCMLILCGIYVPGLMPRGLVPSVYNRINVISFRFEFHYHYRYFSPDHVRM